MKRFDLLGVYEWGLLAVLFLIVLHAPFSVFVGNLLPEYETILKAWKEIVLTGLGVLALVLISRRGLWKELLQSWLIRLALVFIGLHLLLALLLGGDAESIIAGLMIDLRFIAMFILMYVLIALRPESVRRMVLSIAAGAAIVLGFGLLQITVLPDDVLRGVGYSRDTITPFTTIDSNSDYVRINSTLRGPNPLGAVAVIYAALALAYLLKRRTDIRSREAILLGIGFLSSIAVLFASYSRSAYIAVAVALVAVVVFARKVSKKLLLSAAALAAVTVIGLLFVSTTDWFSNVILHEDPESTVVSKSNDGHIESLQIGAYRAATQPLGAGVGSTGSASLYDDETSNDAIIENYYFFVAHESGWLGLGLFLALFGLVMATLWRKLVEWLSVALFASGLGLAVIGLLLPVWADETVALIWWGMAGALVAPRGIIGGRHGRPTRKQTTARTS